MKLFLISALLVCFATGNAQTNYVIDYSYKSLGASCNVFSVDQTVDGYIHQTTKGFPNFVGNPDYYVNLPCKRITISSQIGTDYQILFPFKKGFKYEINVLYKGTISSASEPYPVLALTLNLTKKTQNTSTACSSGPQAIDKANYLATSVSGNSFAWSTTSIINTNALSQNYESLSIASIPTPRAYPSGMQGIQIRKIQITEVAPVIIPPPPTSNFEAKFFKNVLNGKSYIGMRGKYRQIFTSTDHTFIPASIDYININVDPVASLIGDIFPYESLLPLDYGWDDPIKIKTAYLYETSTSKWYLGEFRYKLPVTGGLTDPLQLDLTELTNITFSQYHFKNVAQNSAKSFLYYSDGNFEQNVNLITVSTVNTNDIIYLSSINIPSNSLYNKAVYLNKLPNLLGY